MKNSILVLCCLLMHTTLIAQNRIYGNIIDSANKPIAGVAIIMQTSDGQYLSSTISTTDGYFEIISSERPYILLFQHLSYQSRSIADIKNNIGDVILEDNINVIGDVVVVGDKPYVMVEDGKLIYDSADISARFAVNNAYDVLKRTPGVIETDEHLSLAGASGLAIIINGRPSSLSPEQLVDLLKTMPSSRIAKIEVMYVAPPQYHIRGAAINVVLRSNLSNTITGEVFGEFRNKHENGWSSGGTLLFQSSKISGDVMYSYSSVKEPTYIKLFSKHLLNDEEFIIRQSQQLDNHIRVHNVRTSIDYTINDNNSVNLTYTAAIEPNNNGATSSWGSLSNSVSKKFANDGMHNLSLSYDMSSKLTLGVDYTNYKLNSKQVLCEESGYNMFDFSSFASQRINKIETYLDGNVDLNNWPIKYGVSFDYARSKDLQTYISELGDMSKDDTASMLEEYTYDLYAGFDKQFNNRLSMSAYISGEYYRRNGYSKWGLFPQLSLTYVFNPNHIIQAGVSSDKTYPSYWAMQESVSYIDGYAKIYGNPNLKPMYNYQGSAMYIFKQKYIFQLFYTFSKDYFQQSAYQSDKELALLYQTLNWDYMRSYGLNAIVPFNIGRIWRGSFALMAANIAVKNSNYNELNIYKDKWLGRINMDNSFLLCNTPSISLDISGYYQTPTIQCSYDLAASWSVNAGIKITFLKDKLSLTAMCNDIFESAIPKAVVNISPQYLEMLNNKYTRTFKIRLSYSMGNYKSKEHDKIDTSRFGH